MSHQKITMSELTFIAETNLASGQWQPMILLGPPGVAKTMWVERELPHIYAEALGVDVSEIGYVEEHPAERDAAEIAGVALPCKNPDGSVATMFTSSPLVGRILATGKKFGILNADEIAAAGQPEQKCMRGAFHPDCHRIGISDIPKGWIVVGTGNRAKDKAGSGRLMAHLVNAALVFEVIFEINSWDRWAERNNVNVVMRECAVAHADDGFFADAVPVEDGAFCTPRSLTRSAEHLDAFMASDAFRGTIPPLMERMLAANIGASAASIVAQWVAQRDHIPTAHEIMTDPEGAKVPDQTGFQMIAANLAMGEVNDARTAEAALHYIVRLRPDLQVSLGTKLMRISTRAGWVVNDPLASAFIEKFHQLLPLAAN